jgi:hypothetical protein
LEVGVYGMVNKAVRGFVLKHFDEEVWTRIHTRAGVDADFIAMQTYDDSVTYSLVGAAHEELKMDPKDILDGFGRYWVSDVAVASYADLMSKSGSSFVDFVKNLDHLHERIRVTFPGYQPPSFRIKELGPGELQLDYYSHREGLLDFVTGLLAGLAEHYETEIEISLVPDEAHPMPCRRLLIEHRERSAPVA